ncbi:pyridoxal phosphate-dependent decarboxylase family protein [Pollutibacter soli]|uniref:pyridoxal phosphate-dependent decarboxylase family protein n=1 Tax=Pollutibacter soli TaxID=3034157 RepID=UPI0030134806
MKENPSSPIEIPSSEFKKMGYALVDQVADLFEQIRERPVTTGEDSKAIRNVLGTDSLPENGAAPAEILGKASDLLINHSLFNGHPKFMGYITSSPAPLGALADLLASAVNANVGAQILSPVATQVEKQTIRWLSEFIGLSPDYGGILVSGGNMANFTGFLAGLTAKAGTAYREYGFSQKEHAQLVYCSKATHTWVEKAAILFGLGSKAVKWIATDENNAIDVSALVKEIEADLAAGHKPLMVIGTAGDVSTGALDDFSLLASVAGKYDLWFHIDGAYGIPAAVLPELKVLFTGIEKADSLALDPHKWLYSPLEAGCTLVKNPKHLTDTFSTHPVYYNFSHGDTNPVHNFYEYGLQNSRGFRALKVWLVLQQLGRRGYEELIRKDIELSKYMYNCAEAHPELQAMSQHLSIATFRFVPGGAAENNELLNKLNEDLLNELQAGGELFLSNAVIRGCYSLRACIVNFRTTEKDIDEMMSIILKRGRALFANMQAAGSALPAGQAGQQPAGITR